MKTPTTLLTIVLLALLSLSTQAQTNVTLTGGVLNIVGNAATETITPLPIMARTSSFITR